MTAGPVGDAGVRVRRLRWWDLPAVLKLESVLFPSDGWSAEAFWSELAGVPGTRYYCAAEGPDGELCGYAGLAPAGSTADVTTIAVSPGVQGRGVGGTLLADLLQQARRARASAVLLEVRADNVAALRLYERTGFDRLSVRRRYYSDGTDAVVMRRRLSG